MHGREINFHEVHLAFVFAKEDQSGPRTQAHFFLAGQGVPVCSPSALARLGHKPETVADFLTLGLLHDGAPAGWATWLSGLDSAPPPPTQASTHDGATFEDFNLLRAAALSGQGVALCPQAMIQPDLKSGGLVQVSQRVQDDGFNYYLLSSSTAAPLVTHQAQTFRNWALSEREDLLTIA